MRLGRGQGQALDKCRQVVDKCGDFAEKRRHVLDRCGHVADKGSAVVDKAGHGQVRRLRRLRGQGQV